MVCCFIGLWSKAVEEKKNFHPKLTALAKYIFMEDRLHRKPLEGKCFFIDPKVDKSVAAKIKQNLILLGGTVEDFLDKNINFALTTDDSSRKNSKCSTVHHDKQLRNSQSTCSPFNTSIPSPHLSQQKPSTSIQWKNLTHKTRSTRGSSTNLIDTARKLGIKIRSVEEVWQWLSKKVESISKADDKIQRVPTEIVLKSPCIKIEDSKHKPVYEEFESFSYFDFGVAKNKCPIVNPTKHKPAKSTKKNMHLKGFCECCQSSYVKESKHCKSVEHLRYGETSSHYDKLDKFVTSSGLDFTSFLKRNNAQSPAETDSRTPNHAKRAVVVLDFPSPQLANSTSTSSPTKRRQKTLSPINHEKTNYGIVLRARASVSPQKPNIPCAKPAHLPQSPVRQSPRLRTLRSDFSSPVDAKKSRHIKGECSSSPMRCAETGRQATTRKRDTDCNQTKTTSTVSPCRSGRASSSPRKSVSDKRKCGADSPVQQQTLVPSSPRRSVRTNSPVLSPRLTSRSLKRRLSADSPHSKKSCLVSPRRVRTISQGKQAK